MVYLFIGSVFINCILIFLLVSHWRKLKENTSQVQRVSQDFSQMEVRTRSYFPAFNQYNQAINQLISHVRGVKSDYQATHQQNQQMISSILHDFRTPITSIQGYLQLLRENPDGENASKYFDIVEERVSSLNNLVNEFYIISLLDSDMYELKYQLANPLTQVQERLALYYNELDQTFQHMNISIDEVPIQIDLSIYNFQRIIDNIIRNAFLHGRGNFEVVGCQEKDRILISFSNQANDLDQVDTDQIFNRLYKAESSRSKQSSGLGLSIAKELSEKMGYQLAAVKEDDSLKFILTIPISQGGNDNG